MAKSLHPPILRTFPLQASGLKWYACYTKARHEKRVAEQLRLRGIEEFLPLVPRVSQWKDRRRLVEFPLFPSYVFGRFELSEAHLVLGLPGVASLVKLNGTPVAIPAEELDNVRLFAAALRNSGATADAAAWVSAGQWVEVVSGPFTGVQGVVVERRRRTRVLVGLTGIGQGLEVDIDAGALRPIAAP
jgi:transcription antitermination factor NusG